MSGLFLPPMRSADEPIFIWSLAVSVLPACLYGDSRHSSRTFSDNPSPPLNISTRVKGPQPPAGMLKTAEVK